MKKDDDIKVNKRSTDKIYFESMFMQRVSDALDFLKGEGREILNELDIDDIDERELKEFGEYAIDRIDDMFDDLSRFRSDFVNSEEIPDVVKESAINAKRALFRDDVYIRRAKKKLDNLESSELVDSYKTNIRVIELCDKAIELNKSNFDAYYLKGVALINLKEYDDAIDVLIDALRINNEDVKPWLAIADANRLNGEFDDAIDVYDRVLTMEEDCHDALKGKAHTYFDLEEYEKCDEFFNKAKNIDFLDDESMEIWKIALEKLN